MNFINPSFTSSFFFNIFNKKKINLAAIAITAFFFGQAIAHAEASKDIGDLVGQWRVFDKVTSEHYYSVNIIYNAETNSYNGFLTDLGSRYKSYRICKKCTNSLAGEDLMNQKVVWGLKPKLDKNWQFTGVYDAGKVLDIRSGKPVDLNLSVSSSKNLMHVRHKDSNKSYSKKEFWMRVQ